MTDFIWLDDYDRLVHRLGADQALTAIVGDTDEVLVVEPADSGTPKTVHVLERCNDGKIRERQPGMPWPMFPPDKPHWTDHGPAIVAAVGALLVIVYFVIVLAGL